MYNKTLEELIVITKQTLVSLNTINLNPKKFNKSVFVLTDKDLNVAYHYCPLTLWGSPLLERIFSYEDNSFSISRLRNAIVTQKEDRIHSVCGPIHTSSGEIIGYLGFYSELENNIGLEDSFLEVVLKLISVSLEKRLSKYCENGKDVNEKKYREVLSEKEFDVLKLVVEGKKDEEISGIVHISKSTVRAHLSSIFKKLKVDNRFQLISLYYIMLINDLNIY